MFSTFRYLLASAGLAAAAETHGIDFFLVQDVSFSYENDLPFLQEQIPDIMTNLAAEYSNSTFGMATFVDKPVDPFGYEVSGDFCYDLTFPLTEVVLVEQDGYQVGKLNTETNDDIAKILKNLTTHSGRDWKENQLGALLHAILSEKTGISGASLDPNRTTVIALATDSGYHVRGDAPTLKNTEGIYANESSEWCRSEDYPSVAEVKAALDLTGAKLLLLVTPDLENYYTEFLKELGEDYGFVVGLRDRSQYIAEAVSTGLDFFFAQGFGFGSAASIKFEELLEAEAEAMKVEESLNIEDPAAPAPISTSGHEANQAKAMAFNKPRVVNVEKSGRASKGLRAKGMDVGQVLGAVPTTLQCENSVFEIVWVQDASDTYEGLMADISTNVTSAFNSVSEGFPGSRFGVSSFVDKPVEPFGYAESGDYCAAMRVGLTHEVSDVTESLDNLIIRSGNDWKEAQLHALMGAAYTRAAHWTEEITDAYGRRIIRVAALITDAGYHEEGDSDLPANNGDRYQDCTGEDYPSVEQVGEALRSQMIHPLFLVTENVKIEYTRLLNRMDTNGAVRVYGESGTSIEDLFTSGLQSICGYESVTPAGSRVARPAMEIKENEEGKIEVGLNQRPKFLSIVSKD